MRIMEFRPPGFGRLNLPFISFFLDLNQGAAMWGPFPTFLRQGLASLLSLGLGGTCSLGAQSFEAVNLGVPTFSLKSADPSQDLKPWAWIAVCEMAIRFKNPTSTHKLCQVMEVGYKLAPGTCCADPAFTPKKALGIEDIQRVLWEYGCSTRALKRPHNHLVLWEILKKNQPVIVQLISPNDSSRIVILWGLDVIPFEAQQSVPTLNLSGGGYSMQPRQVTVKAPFIKLNDPLGTYQGQIHFSELQRLWGSGLILE